MTKNKTSFGFLVTSLTLFFLGVVIYSYSQIDLNLTLSTNVIYQKFQERLIYLGYFNRPLSSLILLGIFIISFLIYFLLIKRTLQGKLSTGYLKKILFLYSLLVLAYPAFSHDIFNYMFDARIVTKYQLSPYIFKALDFPADAWIRFMHWTHRYYPYGIGWLILTLLPSLLGMGKFVLTLFLFKLMFASFHLLNCYLIYKLMMNISSKKAVLAVVFYAFNPLILFEGLVSPHNEIMMLSLLLVSLYFWQKKNILIAITGLIFSISIKYLSIIFLPLYAFIPKKFKKLAKWGFFLWLTSLIPLIVSREAYAWYFIPVIGLGALLIESRIIVTITIGLSMGVLFRYLPYFYYGDYGALTTLYQNWAMMIGFIVGAISVFFIWNKKLSADF